MGAARAGTTQHCPSVAKHTVMNHLINTMYSDTNKLEQWANYSCIVKETLGRCVLKTIIPYLPKTKFGI